jgi:hypothetical protein
LSLQFMENRKLVNIHVTKTLSVSVYAAYVEKHGCVVFALNDLGDMKVHTHIVTANGNVITSGESRLVIEGTESRFLGERLEYLVCKVRRLENA